jgi:hypothetical protein
MRAPALALGTLLVAAAIAVGYAVAVEHEDEPPEASVERRPPIVVLVLDEVAADTLVGPDGQIDAARYPNFARLARTSTWFRNGHTVYDSTFKAVPAILDARMPAPGTAADVRSHQPSIYHLLDGLGYGVIKVESGTAVCPPRICPGTRTRRPGVLKRLAGGGRPARLHRWIGAIRQRPRPTFYFHHALLPHEPWIYLPSGRQSRPKGEDPIGGVNRPIGFHDPRLTDHNHLRHLLQVGSVDRELGLLMGRLHRTGLFDRALLIVIADHGYSFELGVPGRRQVTESNIEEIAPVPFFVKTPGQHEGAVDDSLVRTIDIVPTVADVLGVRVPWRHDGYSAFSEITRARDRVEMPKRDFSRIVSIGREELDARRRRLRMWRARKFGTGAQSELMYGDPWASAYRIGPNQDLLGRRVPAATVARSARLRGEVANGTLLGDVEPSDQILPTRVTGRLAGSPPGATRDLAVAVNGRISAVGRSFHLRGKRAEFFSLMVPETAMQPGRNSLELFEVRPGLELVRLAAAP